MNLRDLLPGVSDYLAHADLGGDAFQALPTPAFPGTT